MADGIIIYAPNSTNVLYEMDTIYEGCLEKCSLMQEDYIELHFNVAEPIFFPIGSKCTWNGKEYYVTEAQQPSYDEATGGYRYELKMEAYYRAWKLKIFKYYPDVENGTRETEFSLTAKLKDQVEMLVRCLNKDGFRCNGQEFEAKVDDKNAYFDENNVMTYSSVNYLDALSQISEKWDCEWWVIGNVLYVGKCESSKDGFVDINGDELTDFILGDNVVSMDGSKSQTDYATRLYAFGSDTNLPKNYGKGDVIFTVDSIIKDTNVSPNQYVHVHNEIYTYFFDNKHKSLIRTNYGSTTLPKTEIIGKFEHLSIGEEQNKITYSKQINGNEDIPNVAQGKHVGGDFYQLTGNNQERGFQANIVITGGETTYGSQYAGTYRLYGKYKIYATQSATDLQKNLVKEQEWYIDINNRSFQYGAPYNFSQLINFPYMPEFELANTANVSITIELELSQITNFTNDVKLTFDAQKVYLRSRPNFYEVNVKIVDTRGYPKCEGTLFNATEYDVATNKELNTGTNYIRLDKYYLNKGEEIKISNIIKSRLPTYYYTSEQDIINAKYIKAMSEKRLSLPSPYYIDSEDGLPLDNIVEKVVTYDDEYPKANSEIDIVEAKPNKYIEDEEQTDITYNEYYIHTSGFTFDSDYQLDTADKLEVKFNTGALAGLTFETIFNPSDVTFDKIKDHQAFKVVRQQFEGGLYLPNDAMHPEVGDEFVLLGWDASRIEDLGLIDKAQEHLKKRAELELKNMNVDPTTYECTMFSDYIYGRAEPTVIVDDNGNVVTDERGVAIRTDDSQSGLDKTKNNIFQIGQRVKLHSKAFFKEGYRDSRILGYERKMDIPCDSPVYSVGEKAVYSKINSFEKFMKQQQNNKK